MQAFCVVSIAAGDLKPLPIMCLHLMIWKAHKVRKMDWCPVPLYLLYSNPKGIHYCALYLWSMYFPVCMIGMQYSAFHIFLSYRAQDAKLSNLNTGTQIEHQPCHMHFEGNMYQRF